MTPWDLAVDAVAGYRLTRLVTTDRITERPRAAVIRTAYLIERGQDGVDELRTATEHETWTDVARDDPDAPMTATLVTCPWCTGVYVAVGVALARRFAPRWWRPVAETAAVAAAAGLLARGD